MQDEFPCDPFLLLLHRCPFFLIPHLPSDILNRPPEVPLPTEKCHRQLLPPTMRLALPSPKLSVFAAAFSSLYPSSFRREPELPFQLPIPYKTVLRRRPRVTLLPIRQSVLPERNKLAPGSRRANILLLPP